MSEERNTTQSLTPAPEIELSPGVIPCHIQPPDSEALTITPSEVSVTSLPVSVPGYQLLGELGRGGMGVVYKARHLGLDRLVALKMILAGGQSGTEQLARFKTEAEALATLHHPNIVQIHDFGTHDGRPYFSLEYLEGGSLEKLLNGQPQSPTATGALVEQLALGIQSAHDVGIIHRDIKPANVLLQLKNPSVQSAKGINNKGALDRSLLSVFIPKITDFGLAKTLDSNSTETKAGTILGTPSYMAPEQAEGRKDLTPAVDIYALGTILYESLTGRPPFKATTPFDTVMQVISEEPVPPRRLQSKIPKDLETICLKCLEKAPHRRYQSACALAEDLRHFLNGEPIQARPVGPITRLLKWSRRRPTLASLLMLCGIALLAALWQGWRATIALAEVERQKGFLEHSRDVAEKERVRAQALLRKSVEAVNRLMLRVSDPRLVRLAGFQDERRKMLEEAVTFQRDLLRMESNDPEVRRETGLALFKMAELYWNLGRHREGLQACQEAIALQEGLIQEAPSSPSLRFNLAESLFYRGILETTLAQLQPAERSYLRALTLAEDLTALQPQETKYQQLLAKTHISIGFFHGNNPPVFEKHLRSASEIASQLLRDNPTNPDFQCLRAACCGHLASLMVRQGRIAEAELQLNEARLLLEPIDHTPPQQAQLYDTVLAQYYVVRGNVSAQLGRRSEASQLFTQATAIYEDYLRVQPKSFMYQSMLAPVYLAHFQLLKKVSPSEAEKVMGKAIVLADNMANHQQGASWMTLASRQYRQLLWSYWVELGRTEEAAAAAENYARQVPLGGNTYNAACFRALVARTNAKDNRMSLLNGEHASKGHLQSALAWLRQAKEQGYFNDRRTIDHMLKDNDLVMLHPLAEFQQLVREVESELSQRKPK